eukprot:5832715-Amphidinium_carterae.1
MVLTTMVAIAATAAATKCCSARSAAHTQIGQHSAASQLERYRDIRTQEDISHLCLVCVYPEALLCVERITFVHLDGSLALRRSQPLPSALFDVTQLQRPARPKRSSFQQQHFKERAIWSDSVQQLQRPTYQKQLAVRRMAAMKGASSPEGMNRMTTECGTCMSKTP